MRKKLTLTEQLQGLGFETTEDAVEAGYHILYDTVSGDAYLEYDNVLAQEEHNDAMDARLDSMQQELEAVGELALATAKTVVEIAAAVNKMGENENHYHKEED